MPRDLDALKRPQTTVHLDRAALARLYALLWPRDDPPFRARFGLTIALMSGAAALNAIVPLLFASAVDGFSGRAEPWMAPVAIIGAYVALQWLSRVMNESRWSLYGPIEQRLQRSLARRAMAHLHGLSLSFHLGRRTGQISRILDNGLSGLRELLFDSVFLILPLAAEIVFVAAVMMVRVDAVFATVLLVTLAIYGAILVIGSEWLRSKQRRAVAQGAIAHGEAVDSLINYETVKYFGNEEHVTSRYDRSLAEVERLTVASLRFRSLLGVALSTVLVSGMAAILFLAAARLSAGSISLGDFVLVNAYMLQLIRPMERLGQLYRALKQSFADLEQLLQLLEETPEVGDRPGAVELPPGRGAIAFEHVGFGYGKGRGTLEEIDFAVPPGAKVALVGPTGAGKSTVARLLFRFYDPQAGRIVVDGRDIRDVTQASLRAAIAVVPQDTVLFNDTIGYNIGFGRPGAGQAEIEAAARAAELHDFIAALPDGYATLVGERGLKLSGGEKQRVAIARAVLKNPRIFILDEATSALDSATEKAVQENLARVCRGTTTLVIAHRLSTVVDADIILVLEGGRIVEQGDHATLLRRGGLYATLWRRQAETPGTGEVDEGVETNEALEKKEAAR
ncbi:ABC transporter ATP-binding protein/permease [Alsobacter sp. SYSU M60028]|uniref:ABC transporter ATP-binding protein/permease n=1 Tax=Alsobacter ponti TaxID=2962936 RepID=A0ABT1LDG1_9HYPH|nr:ABC transporter ATP-binding protein/permease [Alsobacter ponti]MCP8939556.1 ABC transporter ATP-binding protein/permease [Alsobacter ponti]